MRDRHAAPILENPYLRRQGWQPTGFVTRDQADYRHDAYRQATYRLGGHVRRCHATRCCLRQRHYRDRLRRGRRSPAGRHQLQKRN
ncbi:hypothetical protein GW17_00005059 [Ensete ventricosum]|nr:hypothetical protein GW17_00005059 [Ensete ventricosum]